jgi:hypothetical protein
MIAAIYARKSTTGEATQDEWKAIEKGGAQ